VNRFFGRGSRVWIRFVALTLLLLAGLIGTHACDNKKPPTYPQTIIVGAGPVVTVTGSATPNSTPNTSPTPIPTVQTFAPEGFEGGSLPAGWSSGSVGATATSLSLSGAQFHTGIHSALTTFIFSGSAQSGQAALHFNPAANFTGKTLSLWYFIDQLPAGSGNNLQIFVDTLPGNSGQFMSLVVGAWTEATFTLVTGSGDFDPTAVSAVGLSLSTSDTAIGPFNTVNFYIDDVAIQ